MSVSTLPAGWAVKSIMWNGRDVSVEPLELTDADVEGVIITFTDRTTQLAGTVIGTDGPDSDAEVVVFPADSVAWKEIGVVARRARNERTTKGGGYAISGLPPGDYFVIALPGNAIGEPRDPKYLETLIGAATRVTLGDGPFTEAALEQFHVLHEREYGSAYGDPIEIVNARVTAVGSRPALEELPVASGTLEQALLGESEGHFRVDGELQSLPTRFFDRALLPLDEPLAGPAVVFHLDTTTVVPPAWTGRADASGNLILTKEAAA